MKRLLLILTGLFPPILTSAEKISVADRTFRQDPFNHPFFPLVIVSAFGVIVLILLIVVLFYGASVIKLLKKHTQTEPQIAVAPVYSKKHFFHAYKWHMYGTGALALVISIMGLSYGFLSISQPQQATKAPEKQEPPKPAIDENALQYTHDIAIIEKGKAVFENTNCASCHRSDGGGNAVGPNLTDEYWLHGGDVKNVYSTIKDGVPDKGMPAWGKALNAEQVRDVAFYILSLQGSNPPDAKAPQGEKFVNVVSIQKDTSKIQAMVK